MSEIFISYSSKDRKQAMALVKRLQASNFEVTDSPEAYALYLKGLACYRKHTREDYDRSIEFREKALRLDPRFVLAHLGIANTCQEYYYRFSQETEFLKRAEKHLSVATSIEGETPRNYQLRSIITLRSGDPQREVQLVQ